MKMYYKMVSTGDDWTVYSVTETNFGHDAQNYICRGTKEYCQSVLDRFTATSKSVVDSLLKDIQE